MGTLQQQQQQQQSSGAPQNATQNASAMDVSNSEQQSAMQENSNSVIESLFSPDYMVELSQSTNVLVQGSNAANNGQISWKASWDAPNGFHKDLNISEKGPSINVPFNFSEAAKDGELKHGDKIKFTVFGEAGGKIDRETREFVVKIPTEELQVWETFFDNADQDSSTDGAQRLDPLVFDLNRDGKLDTTDGSQLGNGQVDKKTVLFDIDPSRNSISGWKRSSPGHRPGYYEGKNNSQAPAVPGGKVVYNTGKTESTDKAGPGRWYEDPSKGSTAKIYDSEGNQVGYWDKSKWGNSHGGRVGQYYWEPSGNPKKEEKTEWLKGTGDGFLVWDVNGNGKIDSSAEMMSEFDASGNKVFENGFEKLAHYFDKDGDGVIQGAELKDLKFWVDNGDGKTQDGELRELSEYGIQKITIPKKGELKSTTTATKEEFIKKPSVKG